MQNVINLEGGKSAIRLTIGSYHRPSGKEIHKWKGAKDSDDWGVRPDPGLESLISNQTNELIILARRRRDYIRWDDLATVPAGSKTAPIEPPAEPPSSSSSPPVPIADAEDAPPPPTTSQEAQAAAAAKQDNAAIDPQLRTAVDYFTKLGTKQKTGIKSDK